MVLSNINYILLYRTVWCEFFHYCFGTPMVWQLQQSGTVPHSERNWWATDGAHTSSAAVPKRWPVVFLMHLGETGHMFSFDRHLRLRHSGCRLFLW